MAKPSKFVQLLAGHIQYYLSKGSSHYGALAKAELKLGQTATEAEAFAALHLAQQGIMASEIAAVGKPKTTVGQLYPDAKLPEGKARLRVRVRKVLCKECEEGTTVNGEVCEPCEGRGYTLESRLIPSLPLQHPTEQ